MNKSGLFIAKSYVRCVDNHGVNLFENENDSEPTRSERKPMFRSIRLIVM